MNVPSTVMETIDLKFNGLLLLSGLLLLRSESNFGKLRDELAPLTNEYRRQMLERSSTVIEVLDRTAVVRLKAPTQLPGLTDDSLTLVNYGERVLVLKYDHDGIKHDWWVDLPAGKVLADDLGLGFEFAPPEESKLSPSKVCRFTLTRPLVIDAATMPKWWG